MDDRPAAPVRPTLKTVSQETGFAVTTVSRALRDDPAIAEKTRAKVHAAAVKLGYVPDRAAQRLRTGRTKVVSLLLNPRHEFLGFTSELLGGIAEGMKGTDYSVTIVPDELDGDRMATLKRILRNNLADGLIFTRTECFDPRVRLLLERDFPFVTHGRTEFTTPHPFVDYDNEAFARAAVARLVSRGRRRLTMILPDSRFTFTQHLRFGFLAAARDAGVAHDVPEEVTLDSPPEALAAYVARRQAMADPPDGHVCVGEVVSMATLAALSDAGARLGEEVEVVAKRASPVFDFMRPRIDTVFEDVHATGHQIGAFLLRRLRGEASNRLQQIDPPIGSFGDRC